MSSAHSASMSSALDYHPLRMTAASLTRSSAAPTASARSPFSSAFSRSGGHAIHAHLERGDKHEGSGKHKGVSRLVGSGAAGFLELLVFHPVDTVAKRLMSSTEKYVVAGDFGATRHKLNQIIFRSAADKGVVTKAFSLFPGLGFAAGYKVLQRAYKFGGQPYVNEFLDKETGHWFRSTFGDKNGKTLMSATAGSIIGIGEIILLPLDVLKIKAQTNPGALKSAQGGATGLSGVVAVLRSSGFSGLYSGALATAARNAPGSFALFGGAAVVHNSVFHLKDAKQATFFQFFCASVAGATASIAVAQPLDIIKTRIQNRPFDSPESGWRIFTKMMKEEGVTALFKGLSPKLLVVGPKLIFSFTIAQYLINYLERTL